MNRRQKVNREILTQLLIANENSSDQRFGQLLVNCGVTVDLGKETNPNWGPPCNQVLYNEESDKTLARVIEATAKLGASSGPSQES